MNGTIFFDDVKQLAEFLTEFSGSTATFEVRQEGTGRWVLTFLGGY